MNKYFDEDDIRIRLLKHISASTSHLTQRDFAAHLGLSLGKAHYCLTELIKSAALTTAPSPIISAKPSWMFRAPSLAPSFSNACAPA
jgi:Winged helix-turn-helix DNA-binding